MKRQGYLVVNAKQGTPSNPAYRGINRVPPYRIGDGGKVAPAMDFYVFGDCKDESNLIPSFEVADGLSHSLSASGQPHEVLVCGDSPSAHIFLEVVGPPIQHLGYDVAGIDGDYWSIVSDFPSAPWAEAFRDKLNENGLFDSAADAGRYLNEYRERGEPDATNTLEVIYLGRCRSE